VFVSSTLGELAEERRAVSRAVSALWLTPVMFEAGARPYPPAEVYRAYLAQADVFIGLYWQRYGQLVPGAQVSGLEDEFELSGGLPRLLYVKAPAPEREPRLADLLARIKDEASVSYRHFRTAAELGRLVRDDLAVLLSERFAAGGQAAAAAQSPPGAHGPGRLPVSTTSLLGRERAIGEVAGLLGRPGVRLVTLTGPGGVGKTRLAVAVGERLRDRFGAGTVFVPLDAVTDPGLVLAAVGRAAGADLARTGSPAEALAETFGDGAWLLILDNLEQVVQVAPHLGELLARCPGLAILGTSRAVLGLRAEREYPVLPLPAGTGAASVAELASSPAVALFVDRARAVRPGFALTEANAAAVAEICRRLEGLPLAIELAADRTRLLDPPALLDRLAASLDALGTGAVDLPERQRTLRATVEWSVGLLTDAERSLLEVAAVFTDGWTISAAARVADLEEDRVLELSEALARHSLIYAGSTELRSRTRMLETIREFVAERLAARPDAAEVGRRHAGFYRALAEQADRPLRGRDRSEWPERLRAEAGNLAATVRWYLAHEPGPLPHLFRVLWLFWTAQDLEREAWSWVEQLPAPDTLNPQESAELAWTAMVLAVDIGDDTAALAARQRLGLLLAGIQDPFLHAVSQLVMAWTLPIAGDFDGALREVTVAPEELRGQDEPVFTAMAAFTAGSLETALGRYDDALRHLRETRDLAERPGGNDWLTAGSRVQLGILAVLRGSLDEARAVLDEALDMSLAACSTPFVTLCLSAYAQLASAEGDPDRAALLEGAAEGLRRRVGLPALPHLRRVEADLVAQVRHRLGPGQFDQAFSAGSRLTQQQAVAIVRDQRGTGTPPP
jgi:predicted ATPase